MTIALPAGCVSGTNACSGRSSALGMTAWLVGAATPRRLLQRLLHALRSQAQSHPSSHPTSSEPSIFSLLLLREYHLVSCPVPNVTSTPPWLHNKFHVPDCS